ncbi:PAS and ANTAR domain-containing protein [Mycolicibacterium novocastrense]|uniref:PAS and ANTAR domain-containing protein n=1 Tax=Mycolicibacterium novocastrense TaxID=59813 RepID=UPI0009E6E528|nr:PAS and ANTAR domain-containing protein [Mycolicibacterium novocastrense]
MTWGDELRSEGIGTRVAFSATDISTSAGERVGSFRYFRAEDRWEWSDTVAQMHGYPLGEAEPSTSLVLSHKHPDDAASVALLIETVTGQGRPFSSRHRIIDTHGNVHPVLVIGERLRDDDGEVIGTQGLYVDLSNVDDTGTVDAAIADFTEHRAIIEQAKGVLMMTYAITAERAFDILVWRSQETNTKLRVLASQLVDDFTAELKVPHEVRQRADHLLLTSHRRIRRADDGRSNAC